MIFFKRFLIFFPFALGALALYFWFYVFNTGSIALHTNVSPFTVVIDGTSYPCPEKVCLIKVKIGQLLLTLNHEGYYPGTKKVQVYRYKTTPIDVQLIKIAQLLPTDEKPSGILSAPPLPTLFQNPTLLGATWSPDQKQIIFLDQTDQRVKLWEKERFRTITTLAGIQPPLTWIWSPEGSMVIGQNDNALYLIDPEQGTRKKVILERGTKNVLWLPNQSTRALASDQNNALWLLDFNEARIDLIPSIFFDLLQGAWIDSEQLVYFHSSDDTTTLSVFDITSFKTNRLLQKENFFVDRIQWDDLKKALYIHNTKENRWYRLDI